MQEASPVKFVVYPRADDVLIKRHRTSSANRQGYVAGKLTEIDEEIFGFGCPIVSKGELNSGANSPASLHVVV